MSKFAHKFLVCLHGEYNILVYSFVETPRKFIIAELSIRKLGSSSVLIILSAYGSKALQNKLTWCFTKLSK